MRALLAVHETAEEVVLRPVTEKIAGESVAAARNDEEQKANAILAELEEMSVDDPTFAAPLANFEQSVVEHAGAEEDEEFSKVLTECDEQERQQMGSKVKAAEAMAPTHPHPLVAGNRPAQMLVGPFAGMVDRVRDAISGFH